DLVGAGSAGGRRDSGDKGGWSLGVCAAARLVGRVVVDRVHAVVAAAAGRRDQDARALRVAAAAVDAVVGLVDAGDATGRARVGRAEGHGDRMVLPAARRVVAGDRSGRVEVGRAHV